MAAAPERSLLNIKTESRLAGKLFPGRFYDSYFINEYGRIESNRAARYGSSFSIVLIEVEGFDEGTDPADSGPVQEFLKRFSAFVLESVRNCDVVGLHDDRFIIIILPETDYFGALAAIRKITKASASITRAEAPQVYFSHATYPKDARGFGELVSQAERGLGVVKGSLLMRRGLKDKLFWEMVGSLSGGEFAETDYATFDAGEGYQLSEFFIDQINDLIVREAARTPQRKGILYVAAKSISPDMPVVRQLATAGATATKVFIIGEGDPGSLDLKNVNPIVIDDPRLRDTFFTFFLNEDTGYALICKENWGATFSCFHTSDAGLVEGLISKLQAEYSLQEQLG